jgi:hypothetical protein
MAVTVVSGPYIATSEPTIAPGAAGARRDAALAKGATLPFDDGGLWELLATGVEAFLKSGKRD